MAELGKRKRIVLLLVSAIIAAAVYFLAISIFDSSEAVFCFLAICAIGATIVGEIYSSRHDSS